MLKDFSKQQPLLSDIRTLRKRARQHIEGGAVTSGYAADRESVIKLLNEALATEIVCVLRYKRHHFMAAGIHAEPVAAEFLEHANEEMQHADRISERIVQLRGEPNFFPDGLSLRRGTCRRSGVAAGGVERLKVLAPWRRRSRIAFVLRFPGEPLHTLAIARSNSR